MPAFGYDFFPGANPLPYEKIPPNGDANTEYAASISGIFSIESVNRRILDYEAALRSFPDQGEEDEIQSVVRLSRDFFNQTLTLTYLLSLFGATGQDGQIQRFTIAYAFTDAIKAVGGAVFYESGDLGFYRNIGENDRLYLELKYSF